MDKSSPAVRFLYGTVPGRVLLSLTLRTRADRAAVRFLRSGLSRPVVGWYARRHRIPLTREEKAGYGSFRDFFARQRPTAVDRHPEHLISPCDGWLSVHPIRPDSSFPIKGFTYRVRDLLEDEDLSRRYQGGTCLIFRLAASDYHHYCYIDDGIQGENHFIPGTLHSVQDAACTAFPVYTLNRRLWTLLSTEHFGPVVQTEVGALVVGGIIPAQTGGRVRRGDPMGRFELAGSTIVQLFEKDRIRLLPQVLEPGISGQEVRVHLGMWIGESCGANDYE